MIVLTDEMSMLPLRQQSKKKNIKGASFFHHQSYPEVCRL